MNDHHLILGRLTDFVTGERLDDTHDERYRQQIARLLVNEKGYPKADITPRDMLLVRADAKCAQVPITFRIRMDGRTAMLVHYGPGSLVTRHRPALAMTRLVEAYQVPVVVVTNGQQADILDGASGQVTATGLGQVPARAQLETTIQQWPWPPIAPKQAVLESRIVMAYEVDGRCPCDTDVCILEQP